MARAAMATHPPKESAVRLGNLEEFLGFRLRRAQNMLSSRFTGAISEFGLRSGQFSSLAVVAANPGISQQEVAREVGQDKSVMVQIVDDLESRGWARRKADPADRRRRMLFITAEGKRQLQIMVDRLRETEREAREEFSTAEFELLKEMLDRLFISIAPAA